MEKKSRLGRGLDALLPTGEESLATAEQTEVPVERIENNPFQPRKAFDDDELASFSESIRTHGILQPLVVRQVGDRFHGDIVSDLGAGLIGGLGLAPGANIGTDAAVFEATHGSAPKYKGQNKINPTALMLSGVLMLHHLNEDDSADRLEAAIAGVIKEGENVTYDLKPTRDDPSAVGTSQFADAVIDKMEKE